jgi:multiple sugar transport system permease protein
MSRDDFSDNSLPPKSRFSFRTKEAIMFYILISPFIVMLFLMKLFPFIWGVVMSFTNFTGYNYDNLKYIGFNNYERVLTDNFAIQSLQATAVIGAITVPMGLFISFALALLLNSKKKGVGIFRTIYYFPSIIPVVATGLMWRILFNNDGGVFNELLGYFGIAPINWLGLDWCRRSLIIFMAWSSGGGILTYLAALKGIPNELYESASIDGANGLQKMFKITIPMLTPVIFFNLVNGLIAAWQIFGQPIFLAANAGSLLSVPYKPNYVYLVHVYQQIFVNQRFGYGLAMIWMLFVFSIACTRLVFYTSKYWVFYENETVDRGVKKKKPAMKQKEVSAVV